MKKWCIIMILGLSEAGYTMPENMQDVLRQDPEGDRWAGFTAAQALVGAGFPVLPCTPGGKAPLASGPFRHGARSATTDREIVRDVFIDTPGANVAIAPDGSFVVVDVDPRHGGSLDAAEALRLPVDGYRERSGSGGWHIPTVMPSGHRAERSTTLGPGLEIKAHRSYVLSPHSWLDGGGWYRPESGRDIWHWGAIPATWEHLHRLKRQETATPTLGHITASHRREAREVIGMLMHAPAPITRDARALLAGFVPPDASPSEADYRLALLASFHSTCPETVAAVLEASSLARPKWRHHPTYLGRTIVKALDRREQLANQQNTTTSFAETAGHTTHMTRALILGLIGTGNTLLVARSQSPGATHCELMGHFGSGGSKSRRLAAIWAFVVAAREAGADSVFLRDDGWLRVPVCDLAEVLGCDRKTVNRALGTLAATGLIERRTDVARVAGSPRADSLVRLTAAV